MTHSYEKTESSRLCRTDPDKTRHDLACQYISQKAGIAEQVFRVVSGHETEVALTENEVLLTRQSFSGTVGFIDVVIRGSFVVEDQSAELPVEYHQVIVAIEVKPQPVLIGEVLRQINLYREHERSLLKGAHRDSRGSIHWVLATIGPISQLNYDSLKKAGIFHVMFGSDFDRWCESYAMGAGSQLAKSIVLGPPSQEEGFKPELVPEEFDFPQFLRI